MLVRIRGLMYVFGYLSVLVTSASKSVFSFVFRFSKELIGAVLTLSGRWNPSRELR